ncbi:cytochrome B [Pseudohoeflea suaedae]|uniref:Cytochrome B n=1 Tax=Pseudohoeflea suaedae TaxID=877384 RepID=A0A4V3A7F3_9HYPH|nr:cytochrome b/b6 domain-containing protein [Pseudohoeflea suaedae]TDH38555.1 cytochrome B [Pseudohoeflea suaedae]
MNKTVRVWDRPVRLFHWSLAASVALCWVTADELQRVHEVAGYTAAGLVGLRLILGLAGTRYARFSQFMRSPGRTLSYARDMLGHREPRYLGHNPLGAAMVVTLLVMVAAIGLTGWMQTTDAYWGVEWVQETHEVLAELLLVAIALHVAGVVHASFRHRENLVGAMITGRKRAPASGDIL